MTVTTNLFSEADLIDGPGQRRDRQAVAFVASLVSLAMDVAPGDLMVAGRRRAPIVHARNVAMYLAHVGFAWPFQRVARAFQLSPSTAAQACKVIEDSRDDPDLDALIAGLEACVGHAPMGAAA